MYGSWGSFLTSVHDSLVVRTDFLVDGNVTDVGFRRSVKIKADALGLRGWVANTTTKKVMGHIEGSPEAVNAFKMWLTVDIHPRATIADAVFSNEHWGYQHKSNNRFSIVYYY